MKSKTVRAIPNGSTERGYLRLSIPKSLDYPNYHLVWFELADGGVLYVNFETPAAVDGWTQLRDVTTAKYKTTAGKAAIHRTVALPVELVRENDIQAGERFEVSREEPNTLVYRRLRERSEHAQDGA